MLVGLPNNKESKLRMFSQESMWDALSTMGGVVTAGIIFLVGYVRLGGRVSEIERREVQACKDRHIMQKDIVKVKEDVAFIRGALTPHDS